jgi:EAL domain-containing protein (putative c-di-GMP-specific phosphodiesterase class I)
LISPADFIPLAEETGLIVPLGMKIFKNACRQLRQWQEMFNSEAPLTMSVNLSAKQFAQKTMVEEIRKIIRDSKIEPGCIRLEVTEGIVMENAAAAIDTLKQLKSIGVQLSIDDFGTGYSSLSYLHRFPFDILKIDRSFVSRMNTDKDSRSIVETIITLAKKLEKSTIAEGVETEAHKTQLSEFSCDYGQGYLFSKPLNSNDAERFLRDGAISENDNYQPAQAITQGGIEAVANQYTM